MCVFFARTAVLSYFEIIVCSSLLENKVHNSRLLLSAAMFHPCILGLCCVWPGRVNTRRGGGGVQLCWLVCNPQFTPRAPAHHAQLLRHSAPCTSARLGLEPIRDHGGAYTLSVNTTMDMHETHFGAQ